ncbi:NADPH-dependent FMN reductase [Myroides sp. LJL119]
MKAILFNGSLDKESFRTSRRIASYYNEKLQEQGLSVQELHLSDYNLPMFDVELIKQPPVAVNKFVADFQQADVFIWLSPLYHGSIPGVMKNALDWLELLSDNENIYLTDKVVAFTAWSAGNQAMQAINTLDNIAKALRAWSLPYSISISTSDLYTDNDISKPYKAKMDLLVDLLVKSSK